MRREGFSNAFCSSMRYSSPGRSTRKQRQADDRGRGPRSYLEVQLRVPYSFPLEEEGAGGEKKASMTTPRPLLNFRPLYLNLSVDVSVPLLSNKRRANMHWLPNMIQIFLQMSRQKANYSVSFNVMRLVKWNNPELE